jgi:urocanate hydratase
MNIATGREISILDMVRAIARELNYDGEFTFENERPADVRRHRGDITLARKLFGFESKTSFDDGIKALREEPERFRRSVKESLIRHVNAINTLSERGMHFWDYGNAFLLESSKAGADVISESGDFRYPSYVEDIMGPLYFEQHTFLQISAPLRYRPASLHDNLYIEQAWESQKMFRLLEKNGSYRNPQQLHYEQND